jgi:hypothetical protein
MEYEDFLGILMSYKKLRDDFSELFSMGFDFLEGKYKLEENVARIFDATLNSHFTEEGVEWIHWFVYENEWGEKDWSRIPTWDRETGKLIERDPVETYGAKDENGNPICYSFESTWDLVKNHLKSKQEKKV